MKWIDLPPVWTVSFIALTWVLPLYTSWAHIPQLGLLLIGVAVLMFLGALAAFAQAKTSVVPRQTPKAMITNGVFRLSRNPIYFADVCLLAGLSFYHGRLFGLILTPVLVWVLVARFIKAEEAVLAKEFGLEFDDYKRQTRRWI